MKTKKDITTLHNVRLTINSSLVRIFSEIFKKFPKIYFFRENPRLYGFTFISDHDLLIFKKNSLELANYKITI